jgi:hypothetical protein
MTFWVHALDGDPTAFAMFRRHYSARKTRPKIRQFVGPGEKMVLVGFMLPALFVWRKFIDDSGQVGVNCAVFRNESPHKSSDMIREAMDLAWQRWPGERFYTTVDASKIRSVNPGCCFKKAGWKVCGKTKRPLDSNRPYG